MTRCGILAPNNLLILPVFGGVFIRRNKPKGHSDLRGLLSTSPEREDTIVVRDPFVD
jgi:hypothetical protein